MTTLGQPSLFEDFPDGPLTAPTSWSRAGASGSPERVVNVLADIEADRIGVRDKTDRIVTIDGDDRIRHSHDDDVIDSLITQGYATTRGTQPRACRHGAITTTVTPIKITARGRQLRHRWSALQPLSTHERRTPP
jgi:hypothetical protein